MEWIRENSDYITITKNYGFFDDVWKLNYGFGESVLRLQTFPHRKRRENQYRFYFDDNYSEYKSFYAYSEYEAIEKAIKIIRKKLVKQAILELEAAKKDWRVMDGEKAKFYDRIFKNRKIVQEVETSKN